MDKLLKRLANFGKPGQVTLKQKLYNKSVEYTLFIYERWVLPQTNIDGAQRISLKEIKLREFRDRKKLLNPYQKEQLIASSQNPQEIQKLSEKVSVQTMYTFPITYDRHKDQYRYRTTNFKKEYTVNESSLNYAYDPDWTEKLLPQRINLKKWFLLFTLSAWWVYQRAQKVEEFDRIKRIEQRAMQNTEVEELQDKQVSFQLFDPAGKPFTEATIRGGRDYYVLWYDAKMKNYLLFIEYLHKKKFIQAKVQTILIVDKPEYMTNILKIRAESKDERMKQDVQVRLKREVTEQERLLKTFDNKNDEETIELDLKKNFFYVINPEGKVIDCAKIYSFLHEENIFKRITAKVSKDIDDRLNKGGL